MNSFEVGTKLEERGNALLTLSEIYYCMHSIAKVDEKMSEYLEKVGLFENLNCLEIYINNH